MDILIQTRSRNTDYAFLHATPMRWWQPFAAYTIFEKPTAILFRTEQSWKLFVSGIPSSRRDRTSTIIRYTIAVEGIGSATAEEQTPLLHLLSAVLTPGGRAAIAAVLDKVFSEEFVASNLPSAKRNLQTETDIKVSKEKVETSKSIERRVLDTLAELPSVGVHRDSKFPNSWLGKTESEGNKAGCKSQSPGRDAQQIKGLAQ